MIEREEPHETVEGISWPIVVLVELAVPQVESLRRALENASIIVLVEGSMLRASQIVKEERPHLVMAPASLPSERTQVLRDAAREAGIELMLLSAKADPAFVVEDVHEAIARSKANREAHKKTR
jgi:hypothetical protein